MALVRARAVASIASLPDELLGWILELAGMSERRSVTLVCPKWKDVFYSQPALWEQLSLSSAELGKHPSDQLRAAWTAAAARLLSRTAPLVRQLTVRDELGHIADSEGGDVGLSNGEAGRLRSLLRRWLRGAAAPQLPSTLAGLLGLADPDRLQTLHLVRRPGVSAAALAVLSHLTTLRQLKLVSHQLPASAPGMLAQLPQLQAVTTLLPSGGSEPLLGALTSLPHLQRLQLCALPSSEPLNLANSLAGLGGLRELSLRTSGERRCTAEEIDAIVEHCPGLTSLVLESRAVGSAYCTLPPLHALTSLCQLRRLEVRGGGAKVPAPASFQCPLDHYALLHGKGHGPFQVATHNQVFFEAQTNELQHAPEWVRVLSCTWDGSELELTGASLAMLDLQDLLPAGASLEGLSLERCHLGSGQLFRCPATEELHTLRALRLRECLLGGDASLGAILEALVCQVADLAVLEVRRCPQLQQLPQTLRHGTELRSLTLAGCGLQDLPAGDYLAGLTHLDLSDNPLSALPPALAQAASLRSLRVDNNKGLQLEEWHASSALQLNAPLRLLSLRDARFDCLPPGCYLQTLERLDFGRNRLQVLPPELAGATALTCLMMDANPKLAVSWEEASSVLLRLPRLCLLDLEDTATPADVLRQLRTAAPWLPTEGLQTAQERSWELGGSKGSLMQTFAARRHLDPRW